MLRQETRASSLSSEHASMARRLKHQEATADLHHTRVEMMLDAEKQKAAYLSEELIQERNVNSLLESDMANLQAQMQQTWEESREHEQWPESHQPSVEKTKERTEPVTFDLPFRVR